MVVVLVVVCETVDVLDWLVLLDTVVELLPLSETEYEEDNESFADEELDDEIETDGESWEL